MEDSALLSQSSGALAGFIGLRLVMRKEKPLVSFADSEISRSISM